MLMNVICLVFGFIAGTLLAPEASWSLLGKWSESLAARERSIARLEALIAAVRPIVDEVDNNTTRAVREAFAKAKVKL